MKRVFKENKIINDDVEKLELNNEICTKLRFNKIDTIGKLCELTRKELKNIDLVQGEIQTIVVKLQLQGLDIKGNDY